MTKDIIKVDFTKINVITKYDKDTNVYSFRCIGERLNDAPYEKEYVTDLIEGHVDKTLTWVISKFKEDYFMGN